MADTKARASTSEIFKYMKKVSKDIEAKYDCEVLFVGLYGSQNYNLADEQSDIDLKVIILPKLKDIVARKKISTTIDTELGQVDVKDLLTYYEVVKKGNFNFLEPFYSDYKIGDKELINLFLDLKVNPKSILGAMLEKEKALDHEYPSKTEEFKKWGFDPKQLHHIVRLLHVLVVNNGCPFIWHLGYSQEFLMDLKRNRRNWTITLAKSTAAESIQEAREILNTLPPFEQVDISEKFDSYLLTKVQANLIESISKNKGDAFIRQHRTFNGEIPSSDLKKFKSLENLNGEDISYIVYEFLTIL